ncbi:MAG: Uncharacterised protein [Gammaproteobacteria bacterium]|nr:MAG: Uncharacterised protein [Gammaproteobacteria bacterium]
MNQFIRNLVLVVMLFSYPLTVLADATARPKANNKLGISKKTQEEKDNSIINKIFKGTYETSKVIENEDLDKIKLDIEELKNRKTGSNDSVSANERILNQIKVLSEMKKDGILTNSEFNDKKKLLLDKLK